jgi:hypothetical protein
MGHWPRCSPMVAGQDLFPEFVGGQPPGRYLGEQCQVLGAGFESLGSHRRQRRRDRVLPRRGLLAGGVGMGLSEELILEVVVRLAAAHRMSPHFRESSARSVLALGVSAVLRGSGKPRPV